jgi:hypothetical protein
VAIKNASAGANNIGGTAMPTFKSPLINLYSRDLPRAMAFYSELGFVETFRTPVSGEPTHVQLKLDGFSLGIATVEAAREAPWPASGRRRALDRNRSLDRRHGFHSDLLGRQGRASSFRSP